MKFKHPEIGICGLSCRLCPAYFSWCRGCKTPDRMKVGCTFIRCAVKERNVEYCWDCPDQASCAKWARHRELGKSWDSFKSYQTLEADIAFIQKNGVAEFAKVQKTREKWLRKTLAGFNDGRSKSYYCIAATVLGIPDLRKAVREAEKRSAGMSLKEKAKILHGLLDEIAAREGCILKIRKYK
jgi:hypothetical protein